jgi:hypothetical protein
MNYGEKIKVAVFESTGEYPYQVIYGENMAAVTDLARISEWVEVEFKKLPEKEIIPVKVKALDEEIKKIYLVAEERVAALQDRKKELLALVYEGASS